MRRDRSIGHEQKICPEQHRPRQATRCVGIRDIFQNEDFSRARRFDRSMNLTRAPREMAIAWAEQERLHIEAD